MSLHNNRVPNHLNFPQIEKLLQQAADKEKELLALLELTPIQIWNTDLDNFLAEWNVSSQSRCWSFADLDTQTTDRKRARSGKRRVSSTQAVRRSSGNRRRSRRASLSAAAVVSVDVVGSVTTLAATTISCLPKRPLQLPLKHRANPSCLLPAHRARGQRHPSRHQNRTWRWKSLFQRQRNGRRLRR